MAAITPDEARKYVQRFALIREIEVAELRRTSMDTKLRQLAALMASRHAFGTNAHRERDVQIVGERWAHLRQALESGGQSR